MRRRQPPIASGNCLYIVLLSLAATAACRHDVVAPKIGPSLAGTWRGWAFGDTLSVTLAGKPCDSTCAGTVIAGSYFDSAAPLQGTFTAGSYAAAVKSPFGVGFGSGAFPLEDYTITIRPNDSAHFGTVVTFSGIFSREDEIVGTATFVSGTTRDSVSIALVKQ